MNEQTKIRCYKCNGSGQVRFLLIFKHTCPNCNGTGFAQTPTIGAVLLKQRLPTGKIPGRRVGPGQTRFTQQPDWSQLGAERVRKQQQNFTKWSQESAERARKWSQESAERARKQHQDFVKRSQENAERIRKQNQDMNRRNHPW